jgi:hypothetical protein
MLPSTTSTAAAKSKHGWKVIKESLLFSRNGHLRSQEWWLTHVIPALRKQRQKDLTFKVSLKSIKRPCLKKTIPKKWPLE